MPLKQVRALELDDPFLGRWALERRSPHALRGLTLFLFTRTGT